MSSERHAQFVTMFVPRVFLYISLFAFGNSCILQSSKFAALMLFDHLKQGKQHQSLSHSPKTSVSGFSVTSGQGSPSDSSGMSRWFKPEVDAPSSIRSIQIEEKAMKDLKRFYSSVKIVKNQS